MKKNNLIIIITCLATLFSAAITASPARLDTVPQTQAIGHMSTSWEDFRTASPSQNIPYIAPPNASVTGDANLEFPITLPEARNGLSPNLSITYSIEGGSTWIGTGWNLSLPSFTLDTRWGVPRYRTNTESEIYLYNGEQLGPVFHRDEAQARVADRTFTLRQETQFQKIIRHGDNPKNYWWEVRSKDGTVNYYGGTPDTGKDNNYCLLTGSGNIAEWYLSETHDVYDNFVKYRYQKIIFKEGTGVYPSSITYNGHKNIEGRYKVEFSLKPKNGTHSQRQDVRINCRSGLIHTMADLLGEIKVSYDNQLIRSYELQYEEGRFLKQLLTSIAEYDQDGNLFYEYDFEYHDDIGGSESNYPLFEDPVQWNVPKDNLDVSPIRATSLAPFLETPTVLGGAKSWNIGSSLAVTFGLNGNLASKANTIGPNGGLFTSNGTGLTALVDMNGDGLPDKIWKEDGKLYYRPNLHDPISKQQAFSNTKFLIEGVTDFSTSNTITTAIGAEINLGAGAVGGFIGYSHETNTTKVHTYFADFNGDELIDIASDQKIYFNSLTSGGHPNFTTSSSNTPSPIFAGEPLDDSLFENDENQDSILRAQNPLHDPVRFWSARKSGNISISGAVNLVEDTDPDTKDLPNKDGVIVSIQHNNSQLWQQIIAPDDYSDKVPFGVSNVAISKGDSIFFRVHSIHNGNSDLVKWDPTITYNNVDLDVVDANNLPENIYKASDDFMVNSETSVVLPADGLITIENNLKKPVLSDSITLQIKGDITIDTTLAPSDVLDGSFNFENVPVTSGTEIQCKIYSKSNVDWTAIEWTPVITYTALSDGGNVNDSNGDPIFSACPPVYRQSFNYNNTFSSPFVSQDSGLAIVEVVVNSSIILSESLEGFLTLKTCGKADSTKHSVNVIDNLGDTIRLATYVEAGDSLYTDLNINIPSGVAFLNITESKVTLNGDTTNIDCGQHYNFNEGDRTFGYLYRGWGQFVYSPPESFGFFPIITGDLAIDEDEAAGDTTLINDGSDPDEAGNTMFDDNQRFIVMRSDPKSSAWRGSDPLTYLTAVTMRSSRKGLQDLDGSGLDFTVTTERKAVILETIAISDAVAGGVSAGGGGVEAGIGGGITPGYTRSILDLTDMNGDRYPDVLFENSIQYTDFGGGLSDLSLAHNWGTHGSSSEAKGGGVGGSYAVTGSKNAGASRGAGSNKSYSRIRSRGRSNLRGTTKAHKTSKGSIGISANFTKDEDRATHTFIDINGDGLEDKIWEGGDIALNLGYSFAPKQKWSFENIRTGTSTDIGAGAGYTWANKSITAGFSASRSTNFCESGFTDINNDALIDQIISVEPMVVRLNTGHGFSNPITVDDQGLLDAGVSIGESANGAITFCIPIWIFKICFNPSPSAGQGTSSISQSFTDIDGDGFVDFLKAEGDDSNLEVRASKIKRTNLLKSYNTPLGGSAELDYTLLGNTSTMPFSKWVLSDVIVNDGVAGDGINIYKKRIEYGDPNYHRHERHFYGYRLVNEYEIDSLENTLRHVANEYHVNDTYRKGLLKKQSILDGQGNINQTTQYDYVLKDLETGLPLPSFFVNTDNGATFPALVQKQVAVYEDKPDERLHRTYRYQYDLFGNIVEALDIDEVGITTKVITSYDYKTDIYLMNNISNETIFGDDILYRETNYVRDEKGNILRKEEKIDDQTFTITEMTYDEYGNTLSLIKPENYKGEKLTYKYKYDEVEHQYVVNELDGYGYEKSFDHEYLYNTLTSSTDINGNETLYKVDSKGRPFSVTYPKELASGQSFSLSFEYVIDGPRSYGLTRHYDEAVDGVLFTLEFEDGLFRSIQTKFNSHIYEGAKERFKYIVSGTDAYDQLARKRASYQPLTQAIADGNQLYNGDADVPPTVVDYDIMDRPLQITDPYGKKTTYVYSIDRDITGQKYLTTTITNPRGHTSTEYYNLRGDIVSERSDGPDGDIWKQYQYDGYMQVVKIIDTYGNETEYTYDLLGRRTSVKVPDAGLTELTYDAAGNLLEKITATIRDEIDVDGSIRYKYDKERLVQIDYPKHFQNKVQIHYGAPQDSFNRAGRIWLQEDATGGREYFFDENGNATKTIRTVMINRTDIYTYVSEAEFDTWNRVLTYKYPDGEVLTYAYHPGGQLASMLGVKPTADENAEGNKEEYLTYIGYDQFLDPKIIEYGNGTKNEFKYDYKRRLEKKSIYLAGNTKVSEEDYSYDEVDNLTSRVNLGAGTADMGGKHSETFEYDILNRLYSAEGNWTGNDDQSYQLLLDYDDLDNLELKDQSSAAAASPDTTNRTLFDYQYDFTDQPTRPSSVGDRRYKYDRNGNLLLSATKEEWQDSLGLDFDQNIFDEENRIMGTSNNGYISRYTYDAFGRRAVKSHGESQVAFINGAAAGFVEHTENYKVNISPYFVVYKNDYRKHYFADKLRILTKVGTGVFQSTIAQGPELTAGGIDYKSRIHQYEQDILEYYGGLGVAPGPPGLLALNGQPEISGSTLPDANAGNPYSSTPLNWPNLAPPDTTGPPGVPVFYANASLTRENVPAGYNFTSGSLAKEVEQFYYHHDHNGNTQYVSDFVGNARQYAMYYPSGERWIHQTQPMSFSPDLTHIMWQGLNLDNETGMYDMGNIYYDPVTNVEQSIDPVLLHFGESTFLQRSEGNLYYDYAVSEDNDEDETFDIQILNTEKPSPYTGASMNKYNFSLANRIKKLKHEHIVKAFGGNPGWEPKASDVKDKSGGFGLAIEELAPHLTLVDITDKVELQKILKKVLITDKIKNFKNSVKSKLQKFRDPKSAGSNKDRKKRTVTFKPNRNFKK